MKPYIWVVILVAILCCPLASEKNFSLAVTGGILFPSDAGYREIYGNTLFHPEVKLTYQADTHVYLFSAFGWLSHEGKTPELHETGETIQRFISLGGGYSGTCGEKTGYSVEIGAISAYFREKILGETIRGTRWGLYLGVGLRYSLGERLFALLNVDYLRASGVVDDIDMIIGGIKTAAGLGVRF